MYPEPNPAYGITRIDDASASVQPTATSWRDRVPQDLMRMGPAALSLAIGAFVGRGVLTPLGVPGWLAMLGGAVALGGLLLALFGRLFAATR